MKSKRVGILMGGLSSERAISIVTGDAIYEALHARGYNVAKVFVDRDIDQVLRQDPIDIAFLALHGTYGEDGCIQGLLEILGIPYTGSGVTASAIAMDKLKSKELFRLHNVPTPPYYELEADEFQDLEEIHGSFGFPAFVKPRREGSSIGAGAARSMTELRQRCEEALRFDQSALVERMIIGREITVGVIDGKALGAIEIAPKSGVYDYKSKYSTGQTDYIYPARLPDTRYQCVLRIAERAIRAVGAIGAARVDMIVTEGENEYVLEVNTLPGMTPTSLLPKIAKGSGYEFGDLCEMILSRAKLHLMRPNYDASMSEAPPAMLGTELVHEAR